MTPLQKPEWLELADNDNATSLRKVSRGLPVLALVVTAAIVGAGAIFAQPQELSVANADSNITTTSQTAQQVVTSDPVPVTVDSVATTNEIPVQSQVAPVVTSASKVKNPSIGIMPTGGGDDGEGDDDEGDDD